MISSAIRRAAVAGALIAATVLVITTASASATGASQPQRRQIAVSALSSFKVILTATRGSGQPAPMATVTAAGYRRSGRHWKLIATKRIGKANQWFWFSVETCSLTTTQLQGVSPVTASDSIKVSLLITPALGCSGTFSKHWRP
jgi:hypothetical protein